MLNDLRSVTSTKGLAVERLKMRARNRIKSPKHRKLEPLAVKINEDDDSDEPNRKVALLEETKPVVEDRRGAPPMLQGLDIYEVVEIREKEGQAYAEIIKNVTQDIVEWSHLDHLQAAHTEAAETKEGHRQGSARDSPSVQLYGQEEGSNERKTTESQRESN